MIIRLAHKFSVVAIALSLNIMVLAAPRTAKELLEAITGAHNATFANETNALTQRLPANDKKAWVGTVAEVQEFISDIAIKKSILPSKEKTAQQEAKRILVDSMARLVRVNNDLLNTIAAAYGIIAIALPADKKATGVREYDHKFKENQIDPKKIDLTSLAVQIEPLAAQKLVVCLTFKIRLNSFR